ncbi:hypothetical protein [Streptomyces sp. AC512_CC834]|uniref:hypothetical protein n=1 Tax=Streptomyces sp. AC512_CC834 TaxID=2823691 RepID=UPI001C26D2FF|nr:hypothetical protein [Streptomyces sp. AC512_CC834]
MRRGLGGGLTRGGRAVAVVLAALMLTGLAAGCSDDAPSGSGEPSANGKDRPAYASPLLEELAHVETSTDVRGVEYGDLAAQRAASGGGRPGEALERLTGIGWSQMARYDRQLREQLGLDSATADRALQVEGDVPSSGRLVGADLDTGKVAARAEKLGARRDGEIAGLDAWRLAPDGRVDPEGLATGLSPAFNVLALGEGTLVRGAGSAAVRALSADGGKGTLAADPAYAGVATCLGTPLAAVMTGSPRGAADRSGTPFVLGAGVTGTDAAHLGQVACRDTSSARAADALAAAVRDRLAGSAPSGDSAPWRELLPGAKVEVVGGDAHTVRITGTSAGGPVLLIESVSRGDLQVLFANP